MKQALSQLKTNSNIPKAGEKTPLIGENFNREMFSLRISNANDSMVLEFGDRRMKLYRN